MAHVRSVEQQYWNLGVSYVQLWATEKAVRLTREVLEREQARSKAGRGNTADVAEAQQRLEQFNLDLVARTSDVITAERQLRNLLGLPPADNRRIIPVTPPTEARLEPDWDKCLATMLDKQPDILLARAMVKEAERVIPPPTSIASPPTWIGSRGRSCRTSRVRESGHRRPMPLAAGRTNCWSGRRLSSSR